jgi:hypothetical protein
MINQLRRKAAMLSPAVAGVIEAVLQTNNSVSADFFSHARLGEVYRAYAISQVLDRRSELIAPTISLPGGRAAEILSRYGLTGQGSENWTQLYEHIGGVVAATVTIAQRMRLDAGDIELARTAALLHDATKRRDVERHGVFASSAENADRSLEQVMRESGYSDPVITAAMNTGREDRVFDSDRSRWASIEQKGVVAAVVGLADTRRSSAHFRSLEQAQTDYLARKRDSASREFFTKQWKPYYLAVEKYLIGKCPQLNLNITDEDIYTEAIFPEVFGPRSSQLVRRRYSFR